MSSNTSVGCDLDKGPETKIEEEYADYWVAYCRSCKVLMAWSREHMMPIDEYSKKIYSEMEFFLVEVADRVYGKGNYYLDHKQRQILDHMHIHGRPI